MSRALQLAANGRGHVSPNPMVGAVVVAPDGRIIGEGWHRRFGGPHAEVNAVNSILPEDECLIHDSTIYVTLEPCSHYGKTPPCAKLLIDKGFKRVVVGAGDPNPKVSGRGIAMIREAGIQVDEHLMEAECWALNQKFMTAHTLHRPWITLKWAQSTDGYMDVNREASSAPWRFSNDLTSQLVHLRRANHDAIAVGANTVLADDPQLNVRHIDGRDPRPVIFDRHGLLKGVRAKLFERNDLIYVDSAMPLTDVLTELYRNHNITSLLVEGGASLLSNFINENLWDEAFVEVAPECLASQGSVKAPVFCSVPADVEHCGKNQLLHFKNKC